MKPTSSLLTPPIAAVGIPPKRDSDERYSHIICHRMVIGAGPLARGVVPLPQDK
jgi:hypothetical protein